MRKKALTYRVGNSHADDPDSEILYTLNFFAKYLHVTCWISVDHKNNGIWHIRTVSAGSIEYFRSRQLKSTGCVCVTAAIWNTSDSVDECPRIGEIGQLELQVGIVTCQKVHDYKLPSASN